MITLVLGPDHASTAISLNNLAVLLDEEGDFAAARPLYERAITIGEKVLATEHPEVATRFRNLARLVNKAGHADDAEPLFRRAITIGENVLPFLASK